MRRAGTAGSLLVVVLVLMGSIAGAASLDAVRHVTGRLAIVEADAGPQADAGVDAASSVDGSGTAPAAPAAPADAANQADGVARHAVLETSDGIVAVDPASVPATARTGTPASAVIGDDGSATVQDVGASPPPIAAVANQRSVLVVNVTFTNAAPFSGPDPADAIAAVNTWYQSASNNKVGFALRAGTVPTVTFPNAYDYCNANFRSMPPDDMVNAALMQQNVNDRMSNYQHVLYRMPPVSPCQFLGIAYVGGNRLIINGDLGLLVTVHELGHNLGLEHANHLDCVNAAGTMYSSIESYGLNRCSTRGYADPFSVMGNFSSGDFTAQQQLQLGWMTTGTNSNVAALTGIDSSTCLYPLAGNSASTRLATFDVPGIGTIALENRQPVGVDSVYSTLNAAPGRRLEGFGVQARAMRPFEPGSDPTPQSHLLAINAEQYSQTGYAYDQAANITPAAPWVFADGQVVVTTSAPTLAGCIPVSVHNGYAPIPPNAPTGVTALPASQSALVSWTAPAAPISFPVTSYTATASPGGATCTTSATATSCTVTGLTNTTSYTFTVKATNAVGTGPASTPSAAVIPPGKFVAVTPARLLDTRSGLPTVDGLYAGGGAIGDGSVRNLLVVGRGGVPSSGVGAVVLNVTVTEPSFGGFVTAYPHGSALPNASTVNFALGQTIPNLAIVKVGPDGTIDLYNRFGNTHVVVDVQGWFPTNVGLTPLTPARLLDTRWGYATVDGNQSGAGALGQTTTRSLPVLGRGGVPASGVGAVALNLTVTNASFGGFVTAFPHGSALPNASTINFGPGQVISAHVIAKLGSGGMVDLYNLAGFVDVVVDVEGWFPTGSDLTSLNPARLMDTRSGPAYLTVDGQAQGAGAIGHGGTRNLSVLGRGGVPASGVGAVALNVTVTAPTGGSVLIVYPHGAARPNASNLNYTPGNEVANMVIAKVGTDGTIDIFNMYGTADVVVDVQGWFPS